MGFCEQLLRTLSTTAALVARPDVAAAGGRDGAQGGGQDGARGGGRAVVVVGDLAPAALEELCVCLVATVCDRVTAGHEQVGHLATYARDPRFCSWRWAEGEACATKQSAFTQAVLTSFTFAPMPRLLAPPGSADDWSHLFDGIPAELGLKRCYTAFQTDLAALATEFDGYNRAAPTRPFPNCWGLWTNQPRLLEVSVNL